VPRVRCVNADGSMVGVITTREARMLAEEHGLDLVEVSPNADPPVCRIMDFGKFRYEESRKQREARKNAHVQGIKEVKFHSNVGEHDYATKVGHIHQFLEKGHKVKLTLTFRGRENVHRELGFEVINRVLVDCSAQANVEMAPRLMGRSVSAILVPKPAKA
jgi:translation initiation factor IF-3